MRRAMCVAAVLSIVAVGAARAQDRGTFEVGAFARYTKFDGDLALKNRVGVGGRLGLYLSPAVSVDVDGAYTKTRPGGDQLATTAAAPNPITYVPVHARLALNVPFSQRLTVLAGLGGVLEHTSVDGGSSATDLGATALLGARVHLTPSLAVRLDGTTDWVPNVGSSSTNAWNLGAQAGISLLLGHTGGPHEALGADSDGDGVINSADRCPGTALHTTVDGSGCPKRQDTDGDGVNNLDDICPNTPAAATVDANGCSAAQRSGDTTSAAPADTAAAAAAADTAAADTAAAKRDTARIKADTAAADRDDDGIIDSVDRCPGTPKGAKVDASGCTGTLDGDGDGVLDDRDKCPTTTPGTKVDASGCPATRKRAPTTTPR
jgi:Outer membrane protein beta-barrel domain/Thrombospondin type 3 repeat